MNNKIYDAFETIHATESLKQTVKARIHNEAAKQPRKLHLPMRYAIACCAMLAVVLCGLGGYSLYQTPVSYISVDINPSVELSLNRFDRVIEATAYNDDGAQILQNLNLNNKPYMQAVELLLADEAVESYLSADALLSFTVVSDKEEALLAGIQQCQGYAQANAVCHSVNAQLVEDAHHNGFSFGKYQAFLELSQYDSSITAEECRNLSMRQIRDLISTYQGESNAAAGGGQDNGHRGQSGNSDHDQHGGGYAYHDGRGNTDNIKPTR